MAFSRNKKEVLPESKTASEIIANYKPSKQPTLEQLNKLAEGIHEFTDNFPVANKDKIKILRGIAYFFDNGNSESGERIADIIPTILLSATDYCNRSTKTLVSVLLTRTQNESSRYPPLSYSEIHLLSLLLLARLSVPVKQRRDRKDFNKSVRSIVDFMFQRLGRITLTTTPKVSLVTRGRTGQKNGTQEVEAYEEDLMSLAMDVNNLLCEKDKAKLVADASGKTPIQQTYEWVAELKGEVDAMNRRSSWPVQGPPNGSNVLTISDRLTTLSRRCQLLLDVLTSKSMRGSKYTIPKEVRELMKELGIEPK